MHAVILAGGKGVRLRPYTTTLPKPLVPIGDQYSILEIVLHQLARYGFPSATIAIGHLGHLIRSYVGDGSRWGLEVDYAMESSPLGTIGPLLTLRDRLPADFLVMNGDVLTDLDFGDLLAVHRAGRAGLTVATYPRQVSIDFGVLKTQDNQIVEFSEKPTIDYRVSMGVYGVSRSVLDRYEPGLPLGFDELVLDELADGRHPREYPFSGYWLDIGRPDDYDRANAEFGALRSVLLQGVPQ
ncbi:MAG TPA: sugar phosphate nucleotidyltransferase [Streptosporangiaceae bacterium]